MADNWLKMSACDLGRSIESGAIDPVDLTDAYLDAIDANAFASRIYSHITTDRARSEAKAAAVRASQGSRLSLLDGVPISWKDLFDSKDAPTEAGSALLKGRIPDADADVLSNATKAGLVCLGKTHMSELAFSGLGYNPITQTPPCVNNHDALPGGSSSGAAASVAFDLAAAGIGSDTGGSVRIPSAWNDLVGLKTTVGDLTLNGVVPLCSDFDTAGPLCRSVEDAGAIYDAMKGQPIKPLQSAEISKLRFLNLTGIALQEIEDAPATAVTNALSKLSAAGARITDGEPDGIHEALSLSGPLYTVSAYGQWHKEIEAAPDKMYSEILARFRAGGKYSGIEYVSAQLRLEELRMSYLAQTADFDAVLLPTSPILPPVVGSVSKDNEVYVRANLLALRNTRIGNLMGLCGLSIPTEIPSCGLMVLAPPFQEKRLLEIGTAIKAAF